jgi:hypothetical protein
MGRKAGVDGKRRVTGKNKEDRPPCFSRRRKS